MMTDEELQAWVEKISIEAFKLPFRHRATFNRRLSTTGGRYFMKTHHIEINPHQLEAYGKEETEKIIKHELCHYHLHLLNKGYQHRDPDFKKLLAEVGGSRYCKSLPNHKKPGRAQYKYVLICQKCGQQYLRKRKVDTKKYGCGKCYGKLFIKMLDSIL